MTPSKATTFPAKADTPPGWNHALGIVLTPTTAILDDSERDWAWCYVITRDIPGWPGYRADTSGLIWSCRARKVGEWKPLSIKPRSHGYSTVRLHQGSIRQGNIKRKDYLIHIIVIETFIGPCPPGMEACHNNGIRSDNRIANLRWDTHKSNYHDSVIHGTYSFGSRHGNSKLTESDIPIIRQLAASGVYQRDIASRFGVHQVCISQILLGKHWGHVK